MLKIISFALLFFLNLQTFALAQETRSATAQETRWKHEDWKTDFSKTSINLGEIIDVIGADDIPSIDDPKFKPAKDETSIPNNEPVIAFTHNNISKAYPLRYMMWHEIVNDVVGGLPVVITYCPLCNTSIVFNRNLDGKAVTFGTTGKLRHSDLVMYDRGEQNWWQQINGKAIVGNRVGEQLKALPSFLISFELFKQRYPNGEVLLADAKRKSLAGQNPYVNYDSTKFPFLFMGDLPQDIEPMMRIAFVQDPEPIAITLPFLKKNTPYRIGNLEFRWQKGQSSALDNRIIAKGKDVGNIEVFKIDKNGKAQPVVYTITFAFAGRAFIPDLKIIQ